MNRSMYALSLSLLIISNQLHANAEKFDAEYFSLAESFRTSNNLEKAIANYRQALRINPQHFEATFQLACCLYAHNDLEEAVTYYQKTVAIKPECAEAYYNLGITLSRLSREEEAVEQFKLATARNPHYTKAYLQLAKLLQNQNKKEEALAALKTVLNLDPKSHEAYVSYGRLARDLEHYDDAIAALRGAVALEPQNTVGLLELANTLNLFENYGEECLALYKKSVEINPNSLTALYNYGFTLKKLGHIKAAIAVYDKVLSMNPNYELARFSRAASYLMLGDFERGWQEYEWRWKAYGESPMKFKQPLWDGSDPRGKRILVYSEQGLGDTLQFVRYAQELKERGAYVIVQVQKPLKQLLTHCRYIDQIISGGDIVPEYDYQIALMSLPLLFKTRVNTVPARIPYLSADPNLVEQWKQKIAHDKNFKIGICWQGNANYSTQFLRQAVAAKSMNVKYFEPIMRLNGVSVYSLQKVFGTDQLKDLDPSVTLHTFGPDFDESHGRFMDTAALIKNLDLVITIDTSICHLAAGLGTPVWNLLPKPADWRWMVETNETPWYPNMRLFRQPTPGDWDTIINEVIGELVKLLPSCTCSDQFVSVRSTQIPEQLPSCTCSDQFAGARTNAPSLLPECTFSDQFSHAQPRHMTSEPTTLRPIAQVADAMAQHLATRQPGEIAECAHEYATYCKKYPALQTLTEQLKEINKQLSVMDKQLHAGTISTFDPAFIRLARKAYYADNLRQYVLQQIRSLEVRG